MNVNRILCRLADLDDEDTSWLSVPETAGHRLRRLLAKLTPEEKQVRYENMADGLNALMLEAVANTGDDEP